MAGDSEGWTSMNGRENLHMRRFIPHRDMRQSRGFDFQTFDIFRQGSA
jgi:hypothetical protein